MNAAKNALSGGKELFPQLDHQKRVIAERIKNNRKSRAKGKGAKVTGSANARQNKSKKSKYDQSNLEQANENLPKAYKLGKTWKSDSGGSSPDRRRAHSESKQTEPPKDNSGNSSESDNSDLDSISDASSSKTPPLVEKTLEKDAENVNDVNLNDLKDMVSALDAPLEIAEKMEDNTVQENEEDINMITTDISEPSVCKPDDNKQEVIQESYLEPVISDDDDNFDDSLRGSDLEEGEIASDD